MINIENQELFGKVVADALSSVECSRSITEDRKQRWLRAIAKAAVRLELPSECLISYDAESETMTIWNVGRNNELYQVNGVCQCKAFLANQPCWHLSSKEIYHQYSELIKPTPPVAFTDSRSDQNRAIYSKSQPAPTKIGGFHL